MDKALKQKRIIGYAIFYAVFGALFIYGTIGLNDLNFDKMVFNPSNPFAFTMACFGMAPKYMMQLFGFTMLGVAYRKYEEALDVAESLFPFFRYLRSNKITYQILRVLYALLPVGYAYGAFMGAHDILDFITWNAYETDIYNAVLNASNSVALASITYNGARIILMVLAYFILKRLAKNYKRELEFMAVVGLALYFSDGIIEVLKVHFHRIRFREMVAFSNGIVGEDGAVHSLHNVKFTRDMIDKTDFHWFTNWYRVGQDDGVVWHDPKSFPSGHTSAASFTFLLVPLMTRTKKLAKYFVPAYIVGVGYVMAMGLSRMMRGAHYMTDVTGAALIMFTVMLIYVGIFDLLQARSDKNLQKKK